MRNTALTPLWRSGVPRWAVRELTTIFCCWTMDRQTEHRQYLMVGKAKSIHNRIRIQRHDNRGHGQTCLEGYRLACDLSAEWVLQIDSDGQSDPKYFAEFWAKRHGHDVFYGKRVERVDGWKHILASMLVRVVVRSSLSNCLSNCCICQSRDYCKPAARTRRNCLSPGRSTGKTIFVGLFVNP